MFKYQHSIYLGSLVNQAVWSIELTFNTTFSFLSFLENSKGELINQTALFTTLYIYIYIYIYIGTNGNKIGGNTNGNKIGGKGGNI